MDVITFTKKKKNYIYIYEYIILYIEIIQFSNEINKLIKF